MLVQPVVALTHGSKAVVDVAAGGSLGQARIGAVGEPGDAASACRLTPVALARPAPAGAERVTATVRGGEARLDALLVMPEVARYAASGTTGSVVLLTSRSAQRGRNGSRSAAPAGSQAVSYDHLGVRTHSGMSGADRVLVEPGGFTLVFRAG